MNTSKIKNYCNFYYLLTSSKAPSFVHTLKFKKRNYFFINKNRIYFIQNNILTQNILLNLNQIESIQNYITKT